MSSLNCTYNALSESKGQGYITYTQQIDDNKKLMDTVCKLTVNLNITEYNVQ